jgi:3-dehydroquinate synthase
VINDFNFLLTLDLRDWIAGTSEAFKVAIIKDRTFLMDLISRAKRLFSRDQESMEILVQHCAQLHSEHISTNGDPFEYGSARPLDFGHWSAHYLEVLTKFDLRHGEAVALGIVLDMIIARNRGLVNEQEYRLVYQGLQDCGFSLWHPVLNTRKEDGTLCIYDGLEEFRQHLGGKLTLIMPDGLGNTCEINGFSYNEVSQAIKEMKADYMKVHCLEVSKD